MSNFQSSTKRFLKSPSILYVGSKCVMCTTLTYDRLLPRILLHPRASCLGPGPCSIYSIECIGASLPSAYPHHTHVHVLPWSSFQAQIRRLWHSHNHPLTSYRPLTYTRSRYHSRSHPVLVYLHRTLCPTILARGFAWLRSHIAPSVLLQPRLL